MPTFIETQIFTRQIVALAADAEYAAFQRWLVANPNAGDVIPGMGGLRKVRMPFIAGTRQARRCAGPVSALRSPGNRVPCVRL